jgi:hypothetical protein
MTLTQKELEVNAALQKTAIEKYTEAMREIAALLHVELDFDSSYHGGLNLQVELGKVFTTLRAVNDERPEILNRKNLRFNSNARAFYFKLENEEMFVVTYETFNCGKTTRIGLGRPQFTFPDYWMKNTSDTIVKEIADRLKFLNALRRLIILTQDVQHESKTQDTAESLARAAKAMAQLELLRHL